MRIKQLKWKIFSCRTEEESNVNEEMNREFNEPYEKLHTVAFVLSHFLLR